MNAPPRFGEALTEVFRLALPLMISTGMFSLVLFADRTLLLWYEDGSKMSAAMAAGNLFWTMVCLPTGIASMTGAIVAQMVGSGREQQVGRFLWQSVWFALGVSPLFVAVALSAPWWFRISGQPAELIDAEATYLRILMLGAVGTMLEAGLSGFFNGIQRTRIIMWTSVGSGLVNFLFDVWLIFGGLGLPALGIAGAAWASVIAFWFKAIVYAAVILRPSFEARFHIRRGFGWEPKLLGKLLFFGTPAGLQHLIEAGVFTVIVLQIGQHGDLPLRATAMAMNFNMIAFIPLIGVSIATSILVGHHLTSGGPAAAITAVRSSLAIGLAYSLIWACLYAFGAEMLLSFYRFGQTDGSLEEAISLARGLLMFVAVYVFLDSIQLILAGALRGAGDTWFVLISSVFASGTSLAIGWWGIEPAVEAWGISHLHGWWAVITLWVWLLAVTMFARYRFGPWKSMRMVS